MISQSQWMGIVSVTLPLNRQPINEKSASEASANEVGFWRPWQAFNLNRNPFGEMTRQERGELAIIDDEILADETLEARNAVQWIGECGRGKTSHLLGLCHRWPEAEYVLLPELGPCGVIPVGHPLIIDEAQRLPAAARRAVFASGLPLVLGTHRDLSRPLRRAGYHVRTIRLGTSVDPARVRCIMNRRLQHCRLSNGPVPQLSFSDAGTLVGRFGTDIRAMEHFLYEQVQSQAFSKARTSHGQMQFVDPVG